MALASPQAQEQYLYYLIIPHWDKLQMRVLLQKQGKHWTLPSLTPHDSHFGSVQQINEYVWNTYSLDAVTLRCLGSVTHGTTFQRYYALDNLHETWQIPAEMRWFSEEDIRALDDALDKEHHRQILYWFQWQHSDASTRAPWMRRGWFSEVAYWMVDLADRMSMGGIQYVQQVRNWSRSCVLRLSTDDGTLYLKAVPEMFNYETVVTRVLSLRYPKNMPQVLAVHPQNGWMLMSDFRGKRLSEISDIEVWKKVLRHYSEVQLDLASNTQSLVALGVPDRNVDYLASQIDRLMIVLPEDLREEERRELRRLAGSFRNMCYELLEHSVPLTLAHGDFNADNVVVTAEGEVLFFDWSDASVSHPFFDLANFLGNLEYYFPNPMEVKYPLLEAYFEVWTRYEPKALLRQVYALAEILADLHQALFYRTYILAHMEQESRWEVGDTVTRLLRRVLQAMRDFRR